MRGLRIGYAGLRLGAHASSFHLDGDGASVNPQAVSIYAGDYSCVWTPVASQGAIVSLFAFQA